MNDAPGQTKGPDRLGAGVPPDVGRDAGLRDVLQIVTGAAPAYDLDSRLAVEKDLARGDRASIGGQRGLGRHAVGRRVVDPELRATERVQLAVYHYALPAQRLSQGRLRCPLVSPRIIDLHLSAAGHIELPADDPTRAVGARRFGKRDPAIGQSI